MISAESWRKLWMKNKNIKHPLNRISRDAFSLIYIAFCSGFFNYVFQPLFLEIAYDSQHHFEYFFG